MRHVLDTSTASISEYQAVTGCTCDAAVCSAAAAIAVYLSHFTVDIAIAVATVVLLSKTNTIATTSLFILINFKVIKTHTKMP
jgi:hypothetical protein